MLKMNIPSQRLIRIILPNLTSYQSSGIQKLILLKKDFVPFNFDGNGEKEKAVISSFINTFCEHQLADNDYMNIILHKNLNNSDTASFYGLSLEHILKHITHIIWTDKVMPDYFVSKVKDNSIYHLLNRLEQIEFKTKLQSLN
jgi:hypothetical protein